MCGIVGYIGKRPALEVLLNGLKRLEYRGYDSAGVAVLGDGLELVKQEGKVAGLAQQVHATWSAGEQERIHAGIAHTRWATHGPPTTRNAHPHVDSGETVAVVHNGIIENYSELRDRLQQQGHTFRSDTDSEVLAQLIGACYAQEADLFTAVCSALREIRGTFGVAVVSPDRPDELVAARRGSPIVIGLGNGETVVASDASAIVQHTSQVIYLDDDDVALVRADGVDLRTIDNVPVSRETAVIEWDSEAAEKSGYDHFMLKEIMEQPDALRNALRGRVDTTRGTAQLGGLHLTSREMAEIQRLIVLACGTSLHAGMIGEYYFEELANIPSEVDQAAEFRYRNPIVTPRDLVVAISQSGETADTLAAVREAKEKGALVAGICNVVGSTIARECGRGVYLHAGPEIGVASTKAFTCQVAVLLALALRFGRGRRISVDRGIELAREIERIPEVASRVLEQNAAIETAAAHFDGVTSCFFIGRGILYPVALEGALKLKEISYLHAEGYHAAELKHGPIALLEENVPVVALALDIAGKEKVIGNMLECQARSAPVIALASEGDERIAQHADMVISIPRTDPLTAPIPAAIALQLLAYHVAHRLGREIDQPRNLAKSVTVE